MTFYTVLTLKDYNKKIRIDGNLAEILTVHLPNTNAESYHLLKYLRKLHNKTDE